MIQRSPQRLLSALALASLLSAGCSDKILTPNQDATLIEVTEVRAASFDGISAKLVAVEYTVEDAEGDDQDIIVTVCHADDSACGYPVQGAGSDGTSYVPTSVGGEPVTRQFVWDIGCGRLADGARLPTSLDQEYITKLNIRGQQAQLISEPYSLTGLGITSLPACAR